MHRRTIACLLVVALCGIFSASAQTPAPFGLSAIFGDERNKGIESAATFSFPLKPGQYVYMGMATGEGKWIRGPRVEILYRTMRAVQVKADAPPGKWEAEVKIWEEPDGQEQRWRIRHRVLGMVTDPLEETVWADETDRYTPEHPKTAEAVPVKMSDETKAIGRKGLDLYVMPFGKEDGRRQAVVVAIGDDLAAFKDIIPVSWKDCPKLPTPRAGPRPAATTRPASIRVAPASQP